MHSTMARLLAHLAVFRAWSVLLGAIGKFVLVMSGRSLAAKALATWQIYERLLTFVV